MIDENDHIASVNAWMDRVATGLPPKRLFAAFERDFAALWLRAYQTLGDVTLPAIVDRVLNIAAEQFPMLSALRVEVTGLRGEGLRARAASLPNDQLASAVRFVLLEFLTVVGDLTAEILTPALHAELARSDAEASRRGGPKGTTKKAREHVANDKERITELERSQRRSQHLFDATRLLTRFQSVKQTVPELVAVIARELPLRSAVFILETAGRPTRMVWHTDDRSGRLRGATAHAQASYDYLVRPGADREHDEATTLALPPLPGTAVSETTETKPTFIVLPLVVEQGSIFGALQIEGARELDEPDLCFMNAVVNHLSIALDQYSTDRALRASAAKLAGIVSIAADAIITIDENQRIVLYNESAEKIFGWSQDEALGQSLDILLPERFRAAHGQHIRNFLESPTIARKMGEGGTVIIGLRKSGMEFPSQAAISKLHINGEWLFTVILRDITAQKRAEHDEEFLADASVILATTLDSRTTLANIAQLALRELADFCVIEFVDEHGEIRRLEVVSSDPNKACVAEALKQFPLDRSRPHLSEEILRSKKPQLVPEVSPETIRAMAQSEEHRRLIEAIAPTSMIGVPLMVRDRILGALIVAACRPERRYDASDLRLLQEVGRRAALALENARLHRTTERAVQVRDDVLGMIAHDLRNPLHTILSAVGILRIVEPEREHQSQSPADIIERAGKRMNRLIQDLLDVSRMEAGFLALERARTHPGQIIFESAEAQNALVLSASLELRLDVAPALPEIWIDRHRLLQVFENLIGNAAKFTAPGGRISVGARPTKGEVLFWVADTGTGIPDADLPHLFDRFWQAGKADSRSSGLGLSIVKGIVDAHGGRVWVESATGRGSTFYFALPVAPMDNRPIETPATTTSQVRQSDNVGTPRAAQ
jgi:PAS domain S-box-containing protein